MGYLRTAGLFRIFFLGLSSITNFTFLILVWRISTGGSVSSNSSTYILVLNRMCFPDDRISALVSSVYCPSCLYKLKKNKNQRTHSLYTYANKEYFVYFFCTSVSSFPTFYIPHGSDSVHFRHPHVAYTRRYRHEHDSHHSHRNEQGRQHGRNETGQWVTIQESDEYAEWGKQQRYRYQYGQPLENLFRGGHNRFF